LDINAKFEQQVEILTERSTTMGIEELLLDRANREGQRKEAIAIARKLKKEGLSFEFMAKVTELPIEEIEKL
jgi:hypothetical protein